MYNCQYVQLYDYVIALLSQQNNSNIKRILICRGISMHSKRKIYIYVYLHICKAYIHGNIF